MSFQPFGYNFTVKSQLPPAEVRTLIRLNKKKIFDPKLGTRGWVVGPVICLWLTPYETTGPSLLGLVSADGEGARVHGRAGSNLFGVVFSSLLMFFVGVFLLFGSLTDREAVAALVGFLFTVPIIVPLLYWQAHKKRREAEPLVRFIDTNV